MSRICFRTPWNHCVSYFVGIVKFKCISRVMKKQECIFTRENLEKNHALFIKREHKLEMCAGARACMFVQTKTIT